MNVVDELLLAFGEDEDGLQRVASSGSGKTRIVSQGFESLYLKFTDDNTACINRWKNFPEERAVTCGCMDGLIFQEFVIFYRFVKLRVSEEVVGLLSFAFPLLPCCRGAWEVEFWVPLFEFLKDDALPYPARTDEEDEFPVGRGGAVCVHGQMVAVRRLIAKAPRKLFCRIMTKMWGESRI